MPDAPKPALVLPPPAPQSELEGLRQGYKNLGEGVVPEKGVDPSAPTRVHGDATRHPMNGKFTRKPN